MAVGALEPKFYDRLFKGMLMLHRQPNLHARKGVTYSYMCCRGWKLTTGIKTFIIREIIYSDLQALNKTSLNIFYKT